MRGNGSAVWGRTTRMDENGFGGESVHDGRWTSRDRVDLNSFLRGYCACCSCCRPYAANMDCHGPPRALLTVLQRLNWKLGDFNDKIDSTQRYPSRWVRLEDITWSNAARCSIPELRCVHTLHQERDPPPTCRSGSGFFSPVHRLGMAALESKSRTIESSYLLSPSPTVDLREFRDRHTPL